MLDQIPLQLDRDGIKETEGDERGGGGGGGNYLKYYHQRGVIIQWRRLIEGQLLFEEIRHVGFLFGLSILVA